MLFLLLFAFTFTSEVQRVLDGDTVELSDNQKVRLAQIDAPEKKQEGGPEAKLALERLVLNQTVRVEYEKIDRYGRIIGQIYLEDKDVNLTLVSEGWVWVYRAYPHEAAYVYAEEKARIEHLGLWNTEAPLPPWEYRKLSKKH